MINLQNLCDITHDIRCFMYHWIHKYIGDGTVLMVKATPINNKGRTVDQFEDFGNSD